MVLVCERGIVAIGDGVSAIASLAVTFGGFSPTAMDGVDASRAQVERLEREQAKKKELASKKRAMELARVSKPFKREVADNITWTCVVVDESMVRLVGCETSASSITLPDEIDGLPVTSIGSDACSRIESLEEIICSDSVVFIGSCAFRLNDNLKRVVLPAGVAEFSSTWLQKCPQLEEVVLPGMLDCIPLAVFDNAHVKKLTIGPSAREIEPGAFQKTNLESLDIANDNPFMKSDGTAIYSIDGSTLLAIALPVSSYAVLPGCTTIAKKAAYGLESLREVSLPESVTSIGQFAFSHSGITSLACPPALTEIHEKAFYYSRDLTSISLGDNVKSIGDSAFEGSGLRHLVIPASIEHIGTSITANSNIKHAGPDCTLFIDEESPSLFLDGQGGLYHRESDGVHLVQLIDPDAEYYTALEGTAIIEEYAFARHPRIETIVIPEGVTEIRPNAFRYSTWLKNVQLPDSVTVIGDNAFLDTALESFTVPRNLVRLGSNALVTMGAHHGEEVPSLGSVKVAEGNDRFYVSCGMLCERKEDGDHVIVFTSSEDRVEFPESVVFVEAYAFNNARGIDYLSLNRGLRGIGASGLATWCWIRHIHVETAEPIEGRTSFDFHFPDTPKSVHGISLGVGGASWVNVPGIMAQFDICLINAHDYNSPRNPDSIPIYDQVGMVIDRLQDPLLLTKVNRSMYERLLRNHLLEICVDIARHDDRAMIDYLVEAGYITADNLEEVIMAVGVLQDAAMSGYLLELKRRRFGRAAFDFDL